jgi:hypothetical protein
MQSDLHFRIVILSVEPGAWCPSCGLPSVCTVRYVLEPATGSAPDWVRLLTYCEACDGA